ncbi:MAG: hypothetical protein ACI9U2_000812, partial [Bradymonadia bacterium]
MLHTMKTLALIPLCLFAACATANPEDDPMFRGAPDALVGGGGDGGVGNIAVTSFVFYQVGADGYMASAAGTDPRL